MSSFHFLRRSTAGPNTNSAVRAFQSAHGLQVDGQVGPLTWETLVGD